MESTSSCVAGAPASRDAGAHCDASVSAVDVALVRELLESAERRHRRISDQVAEFGDDPDPHAVQYPVKDARRHDFALKPRLRACPGLLRDFLLVRYEDESETCARRWGSSIGMGQAQSDEESGDDGDGGPLERLQRRERVHKRRMEKNYAKLRFVFSQLHRAAVEMGEQLYERVRSMVRRSVASGVLNRHANLVRLESIYKLELRRQVTVEKLLEAVKARDAERRRKKQRKQRDEQHVRAQTLRRLSGLLAAQGNPSGVAAELTDGSAQSSAHPDPANVSQQYERFWDYQHSEMEPTKSAHFFKMHALERVLAAERRHGGGVFQRQSSFATADAPQRLVSEQTEELIHEKLTAFVYSRSRDTFPVWKEPPESAFSREETLRQLKRLLPVLLAMPLFAGLSVEQLIEFARATKWRTHSGRGATVLEQGASMEELVVVMDGKLDLLPQLGTSVSKADVERAGAADRADELAGESGSAAAALEPATAPCKAVSTHFGELGMLSKTEVWRTTLFVQSPTVKTLVLARVAFDSVLQRLFGGSKGRQAQRPSSSPAVGARGLAALSSTRPVTAAAPAATRDRNVATPKPHYPSFDAPMRADSSSGPTFAHMFRLKWAQPIAFPMESLDALVASEWAPPLPDTSALVDLLSPGSLSSAHLLFEKRSVLVKENLRSVCFHHQFLDSTHRSPTRASDSAAPDAGDDGSGRAEPHATNAAAGYESAGENGPMTLAQFSEARRRSENNGGSRRRLIVSSSAQSLLASPTATGSATAMKLGRMPFSRSSFVSDTSFYPDRRGTRRRTQLSPNNEDDDDPDDPDDPDGDSESESDDAAELSDATSRGLSAYNQASPAHDTRTLQAAAAGPSDEDARGEDTERNGSGPATRARKMALDSLLSTVAAKSPRKSQPLDANTAQEIIVGKYLRAAADAHEATTPPSPRRRAIHPAKQLHDPPPLLNGINASVPNAHAPLPLRVELQRRMEVVLAGLQLKPKAKLELVLKYTHADHYDRFQMAVVLWEQALHYITKREAALARLRTFELVASDPRRHFRSLSTRRLAEQKERDALFRALHDATNVCREALAELEKQCGDAVLFGERAYAEKMKTDYTELLFDVEQERLQLIYGGVRPSVASDDGRGELLDNDAETGATTTTKKPATLLERQRESIYVNIAETRAQEERRAALEAQRLQGADEHDRRRRSSVVATHRTALRVMLQRQTELDELTQRLQTNNRGAAPRDSKGLESGFVSALLDEARPATATRALHRFIHRPKD
ncbi:hypothetical protein PybrP1_005204 [[Pythium] brassicae (nom. inval.)]|nr:hypothetical protein PybrP1_005204 [[Pythium] brassicae (nom. inval.)]